MKEEYSYFRAEGRALEAVLQGKQAGKEASAIDTALCGKYGASEMDFGDNCQVRGLAFRTGTPIPGGWSVVRNDNRIANVLDAMSGQFRAAPPPSSADGKALQQASDAWNAHAHVETFGLHEAFAGAAHRRGWPREIGREGENPKLNTAFVRASSVLPENSGAVQEDSIWTARNKDRPHVVRDMLCYREMDGHYYIRVPNDENGQPRVTPPDAVRIPLDTMLEIDRREYAAIEARFTRAMAQGKKRPPAPGHH